MDWIPRSGNGIINNQNEFVSQYFQAYHFEFGSRFVYHIRGYVVMMKTGNKKNVMVSVPSNSSVQCVSSKTIS